MPILRTVANLWMMEKSNAEAREISHRAGDLYNQVGRVARRLQRLGQSLNTANGHYNDAVRALIGKQGLHGKVERLRQISPAANRAIPDPGTVGLRGRPPATRPRNQRGSGRYRRPRRPTGDQRRRQRELDHSLLHIADRS